MNKNLYRLLAAHFPEDKAAACMILPDGRVWTYGDVERASARIAHLIVALGLQPGDRVAAQVEKTPEALVLYLASLRAGMIFLPLNPAYQRHELEYFLLDAKPGLFVCRPQVSALAVEIARLPEDIRGFGHVKLRHVKAVEPRWDALMKRWRDGPVAAVQRAA